MGARDPGMFALKGALRAAIVMPVAFAFSLVVLDAKQTALFAAFGSMALLVFVDFGGSPPRRLRAYLLLLLVGAVLITLGTLCSRSIWLATVVMGLIAFVILFAGVLDDYVAASRAAAMLTFVLPVMVSAHASAIPMRLAGWGLAGALCIPATLLLWPARPRSALSSGAARAARSLAELVEARFDGDGEAAEAAARAAHGATTAVRDRFVSMAQRPSGTAGPTAALARLIEDLGWLHRFADAMPAMGSPAATCPSERAEIGAAAPAALRGIASELEGVASDATGDLTRLRDAHDALGRAELAHFQTLRPDHDEAEATVELDEAYRLRALSFGTLQTGRDALQSCSDRRPALAPPSPRDRALSGRQARALLRTHASTNSVWMRNSLRGAVGLSLAVLVGQLTDLQNAFWIVLGTMSVLRSSALSTSATIASALLGTLAGIVVGGLIVLALGNDHGALWAVLPFAVLLAAYAPQAISFAAGQAAFTLVVLVLFNLINPVGWKVGIVRAEDVAIGAGVSLLVGILIWPRGATAILRATVGAAYVASAHYLDATITALLGEGDEALAASAAREATDTAQLLDTAVRDYIANRSSARGRLHDLTLLSVGASRMRRVARLLHDAHSFMRLTPIGDESPRLAHARDALDAERRALCDWYASLGMAITSVARPPGPEREGVPGRAGPAVVLERAQRGDSVQPGLAIAWAQRHLDVLGELEPTLASAYGRIDDRVGADTGARSARRGV